MPLTEAILVIIGTATLTILAWIHGYREGLSNKPTKEENTNAQH